MQHEMFLMSADMREVYARLSARRKAPLVERAQHGIRIPEDAVQVCDGAPDSGRKECSL